MDDRAVKISSVIGSQNIVRLHKVCRSDSSSMALNRVGRLSNVSQMDGDVLGFKYIRTDGVQVRLR